MELTDLDGLEKVLDPSCVQALSAWRSGLAALDGCDAVGDVLFDQDLADELRDLLAVAAGAAGRNPVVPGFAEVSANPDAQRAIDTLQDAFYRDLEFGTAGLRGVLGVGTNRMNVYTVARATQGLAAYLKTTNPHPSVAICRDSRTKGQLFAQVAAGVLAANGVRAFVYPRIQPTPALSFAVRDLGCDAGINITASHNPASYNGYKVYGPDGCQITSKAADAIAAHIRHCDPFDPASLHYLGFDQALSLGLASWIGEETLGRYLDAVWAQSREPHVEASAPAPAAPLQVVYTPLNGAGLECITSILGRMSDVKVHLVTEQAEPNGDFPTCPTPNPETRQALDLALRLADQVCPDLVLASDPDADRVGVACQDASSSDGYRLITGNEMGILLTDYLCRHALAQGRDLAECVVVTTLVSSAMTDALAAHYGFELRRTPTGFKYIGEQIAQLEAQGRPDRFLLGFEESYGYLAGTYVRDKDAVVASMLICQMAKEYKGRGMTLAQGLDELYGRFGYWLNRTVSLTYPGLAGARKMQGLMAKLRVEFVDTVANIPTDAKVDYLPDADMVELRLAGGAKVVIRPSGTEPKIKAYLFVQAQELSNAQRQLEALDRGVRELLA